MENGVPAKQRMFYHHAPSHAPHRPNSKLFLPETLGIPIWIIIPVAISRHFRKKTKMEVPEKIGVPRYLIYSKRCPFETIHFGISWGTTILEKTTIYLGDPFFAACYPSKPLKWNRWLEVDGRNHPGIILLKYPEVKKTKQYQLYHQWASGKINSKVTFLSSRILNSHQ